MAEDLLVNETNGLEIEDEDENGSDELKKILVRHCEKVGLKSEVKDFFGTTYVLIEMPNGREKRLLELTSKKQIKKALNLAFEKFVFLGDYVAIANYEESTIEAIISAMNGMPSSFLARKILGIAEDGKKQIFTLNDDSSQVKIEISRPTEVMSLLAEGPLMGKMSHLSVKLSGITINQHNKSLDLLRRITDSLFFQLDMQSGLALSLVRDKRSLRRTRKHRFKTEIDLDFPRVEFDKEPISLYWYARSAMGMPLLQFLAFYQVIEYYYPTYSQEETRKRIRTILKDPTFRYDRDADIGRLLAILSGGGRGLGDERSQLRATLNACLDPIELREFFSEDTERESFFSSKQKGLTDCKISFGLKDQDLRDQVAELIYDIRCKIVHTKRESSDQVELLLPFSKEAELLFQDVELMQYVARKVLIAASVPLSL
jgi:hypothetical protein